MRLIILTWVLILTLGISFADSPKPVTIPTCHSKIGVYIYRHRPSGDGKVEVYTFAITHRDCTYELSNEFELSKPVSVAKVKVIEQKLLEAYKLSLQTDPSIISLPKPDVTE